MDAASHHVRRLRWQARAADTAQALALRTLLRERSEEVSATMQRVFDQAVPAAEVWQLPHLQLRLQATDLQALRDDFTAAVERALRQALADLPRPSLSSELPSASWPPDRSDAAPSRRSAAQAAAAALRHYLATGRPDATWAALDETRLVHALRDTAQAWAEAARTDPATIDALLGHAPLRSRIGAMLRWLALIPPPRRQAWWQSHRPAPPLAGQGQGPGLDREAGDDLEWQALWLAWPPEGPRLPTAAHRTEARDWLAGPRSMHPRALAVARAAFAVPADRLAVRNAEAEPAPTATSTTPAVGREVPSATEAPAQPVPLAGLVLLHPYLTRLLGGCGLLGADGRSVPDPGYPRACALLHALARGDAQPVEHQLPLVKLLLGREPDEPLTAALPTLATEDREEIDALLGAVREHWPALRGSGPETLRLSFLQRPGLLSRQDGAMRLRLQTEAFDVLLGLLPWSIGWVRLPWMREPLAVEWPSP